MKILFFSPYNAVWPHAFPEALIAESLKRSGHEIAFVRCNGEFNNFCVAMAAFGLNQESPEEEKQNICSQCRANKSLLTKRFKFKTYDIDDCLNSVDRSEIESKLLEFTKTNFTSLEIHGVVPGRLALYEFLITQKKGDLNFSDHEWNRYLISLRNCIKTSIAAKKILKEVKPDVIITYNSLYSTNATFCQVGKQLGIPNYFLHAGPNLSGRLQKIILARGHAFNFIEAMKKAWVQQKAIPLTSVELSQVTRHFIELLKGKSAFAYSAKLQIQGKSLKEHFKIAAGQKVLVAALSSSDELFAAEKSGFFPEDYKLVFQNQIEWVRALINYVTHKPELFLIVRVHPREFPNKREGLKSQHAKLLEESLRDLPPNMAINWPTDEISIFKIADIADLFLNCWSSAGKEMALLGIPVLTYCEQLLGYPPELNFSAHHVADYFSKLEEALNAGWDFERARRSFRWHVIEYSRSVIDISKGCHLKDFTERNLLDKILQKTFNKLDKMFFQKLDCLRRPQTAPYDKLVNSVIVNNFDSPLQVHAPLQSDFATSDLRESLRVRHELFRLYDAIGADRLKVKLALHFQRISDSDL